MIDDVFNIFANLRWRQKGFRIQESGVRRRISEGNSESENPEFRSSILGFSPPES
jgi:hypothetical protein